MKSIAKILLLPASFLLFSCGLVGSGSSGGEETLLPGDMEISSPTNAITFNVTESEAVYKIIPFSNGLTKPVSVADLLFAGNACADFTIYDVADSAGASVGPYGYRNLTVPAGRSIKITVKYQISSCAITSYETTLWIYYADGDSNLRESAILRPVGGTPPGPPPTPPIDANCEDEEEPAYVDQETTGLPEAGEYFIRVNRMASYIYPTAAPGFNRLVGTDIDVDPDAYTEAYLKATVLGAVEQNFTLGQITSCNQFFLPSSEEDPNFGGALTLLASSADVTGTIGAGGEVQLNGLTIILHAVGIPIDSEHANVRDAAGNFRAAATLNLTTGETTSDTDLSHVAELDGFTDGVMNLIDSPDGMRQFGSPLTGGNVTLVGKGTFVMPPDGNFIGNLSTAKPFLIDAPAYLYVQIEATLTKIEEVAE
ncbi:MAG: hypothetical protein Q7T11_04495 [Deltaproteobacteria bacterium]|nr:hypothetical protein [Deltaproteobacteria bacterium]